MVLATVLVGCEKTEEVNGSGEKSAKGEPAKKEEISLALATKYSSNSGLYIALEKGFFNEENLEVNIKSFESSNAVNVAVASGSVDIGGAGLTADLYNVIASGQKIVIAADKGREQKGYLFSAVVVNHDSPIQSIEDLKGKKAGVTTIGSTLHYNLGRILENHGMTTNDVQWVPMNSSRGVIEALRSKNVDVAVLNEPNVTAAVKQGYGKVIAWVADEIDFQSSGIFFSPKFASNTDAAVRFLKAYVKGARYYYDAVLTQKDGKPVKGQNYDEVVKIIAKYTDQPEEIITESLSFIDPDGKLNVANIQAQIDWYAKEKLIAKKIETAGIVNTELLDQALK
jgi:NitT/TauT family transport system substrate-binding protein